MAAPGTDATAVALPRQARFPAFGSAALLRGSVVLWLSIIVLLPLAALVSRSFDDGIGAFFDAATSPRALHALKLTLLASALVVAINVLAGPMSALVLVGCQFRGKNLVNALIDLPFALPTVVAGLTLLTLYGPNSPVGI